MRKIFVLTLLLCLFIPSLFSQNYRIAEASYNTEGKFKLTTTKKYNLERNYPLDKKTVFDEEKLALYLKNYEQELQNSRFFEKIEVSYEATGQTESHKVNDSFEEVILIRVNVSVVDSNHFLLVPYANFKDDSDQTKITPKIKAKDSNFLGSMNSLTTDFNILIKNDKDEDFWTFEPGFNLDYDYPFKAGPFDITWLNSYGLDFTIGDSFPEWDAETGLKFELPFEKIKFVFAAYQYFNGDNDYKKYDDEIYFGNEFRFSTPITLHQFSNYSNLSYTPSVKFKFNWDFNSIHEDNDSLLGPDITLSHSLSNSKINWYNNFRRGYSLSLSNSWPYNFHINEWSPSVSFEGKFFRYVELEERDYLDMAGLAVDFYAFTYINFPNVHYDLSESGYGEKIGSRLRGIADNTYFGNKSQSHTSSTAIVLNIDLPVNFLRTSFEKEIFNFNMQFSPFMDIAIYRDRALPLQTDSAICIGMEGLVYPYKWSSFTIRGSLGFDMKGAISENNLIKGLWHNKEFTIGLGLHY